MGFLSYYVRLLVLSEKGHFDDTFVKNTSDRVYTRGFHPSAHFIDWLQEDPRLSGGSQVITLEESNYGNAGSQY